MKFHHMMMLSGSGTPPISSRVAGWSPVASAHFLVLGFSHGPVCALVAVLRMVNALIGLRVTTVDLRVFWANDGVLKTAGGATMIALSYA